MKLNDEIRSLRAEGSSPEAKGRVIATLKRNDTRTTMKLIGRLSIPAALVAAVALGAVFTVPQTAMASPATVAKAIRKVQDYVIDSFTVVDGKRTLTSRTTVQGKKASRQFFDATGKPVLEGPADLLDGAIYELAVGRPVAGIPVDPPRKGQDKSSQGSGLVEVQGYDLSPGPTSGTPEIVAQEGAREVQGFPLDGAPQGGPKDSKSVRPGVAVKGQKSKGGPLVSGAQSRGGYLVIVPGKASGPIFQSGQTRADYLLRLLDDERRWTVARGVDWNGRKLDRFTLKDMASPIELYVDPKTSLPQVLRFVGPRDAGIPLVEDEYMYGSVPPDQK